MIERRREEETPISPKANSPLPEIFSTKKIFFLNSSCSGSRHSDIPHIESGYCPRDEVSRHLFHRESACCDCDCVSDGCCGCLRRNRQVFFKVFVLALSIALVLLLFGSLSYNLTRNKGADESLEAEKTEFSSHYHEYTVTEEKKLSMPEVEESESVLDLPVPFYEHAVDYDGGREDIEPIRLFPLNQPNVNTQPTVIYDVRDPDRQRRSISVSSDNVVGQNSKNYEPLMQKLYGIEEGMDTFWENYFKKARTVFEPFSLSTPTYSTLPQSDDYFMDDTVIEDELKNSFLSPETEQKVTDSSSNDKSSTEQAGITEKDENIWEEKSGVVTTSETDSKQVIEEEAEDDGAVIRQFTVVKEENLESEVTEKAAKGDVDEFRTWPLFPFPLRLPGILRPHQQDDTPADPPPSDDIKGVSLSDAKKLKKDRRKQMLLNSRVVGGSSDVRLPTGPDSSKPIVNAFETLKTNQQLSFTPSAASQFILPYQMCLFPGPFAGPKFPPHVGQPRTFSFGPLVHPFLDPNSPSKSYQPSQQNFLSFNINNFPNAVPPRPPSGSGFGFPVQNYFSPYSYAGPGANRQPVVCTYLQPPLFQFPTVPGTADFSHAKCVNCQDAARKAEFSAKDIFPSGGKSFCSLDRVSCIDGSGCIPLANWCDDRVHCKDASDEAFCSCRDRIASDRLCDGYIDCPHGEDETNCFDCPKTSFTCENPTSRGSCMPLSMRCDGVPDCPAGEDEMDCSALFFNIRQNDSHHVSQVSGFLHHNWKGDWFPVCVELGDTIWAKEACAGELGFIPAEVEVKYSAVPETYKGPFIVRQEDGSVALREHCKGHISTFVSCPSLKCGTRVETYSHGFISRYFQDKNVEDSRLKREETGRVVGGRESEPRAWPWAIAIYKDGAFHCGGVILDEKWILTAAHCMEQYWNHFYEVRGGMLRRFSFSAMEQVRSVAEVIIHENYDKTIMSNDLALLHLEKPFHFNRWVRPGCLPSLRDGLSKFLWGPAPGTRCIAVGWGALKERGADPDQLREVEIPILTRCKHEEDVVGEEICAGKIEGGKDTCQGDSGGPLLCKDSSNPPSWYVAGIVSHGEGCARPGEPGAYTRISLFVDWITANTNDLQLPVVKPLKTCPGLRCRSGSRLCIPAKWVCNGFTDCLEAEDERNCTTKLNFKERYSDSEYKQSSPDRMTTETVTEKIVLKATEDTSQDLKLIRLTTLESTASPETTKIKSMAVPTDLSEAVGKATTTAEIILKETESTPEISLSIEKATKEAEKGTTQFSKNIEVTEPSKGTHTESASGEAITEVALEEKATELGISDKTRVTVGQSEEVSESEPENTKLSTEYAEEEITKIPTSLIGTVGPQEMTETTGEATVKEFATTSTEVTESVVKIFEIVTTAGEVPEDTFKKGEIITKTKDFTNALAEITVTERDFKEVLSTTTEMVSNTFEVDESTNIVAEDSGEAEFTTDVMETKKIDRTKSLEEMDMTTISLQDEVHTISGSSGGKILLEGLGDSEEDKTDSYNDEYEVDKEKKFDIEDDAEKVEKENEDEGEDEEGDKKGEENSKEEKETKEDTSESKEETTTQFYEESTTEEEAKGTISTEAFYTSLGIDPRYMAEITSETSVTSHSVQTRETTYQNSETSSEEMTNYFTEMTDVVSKSSLNSTAYFQCRYIVQSILETYRCDGMEDCEDGSDEENCTCIQIMLSTNPKLICDGQVDCPDRSDEANCSTCPKGRYLCPLSRECIPLGGRCDGEHNCELGEDEAKCVGLSPTGEEEQFVQTEGFFMTNRKGIWTIECQEESPLTPAMAIDVCSALGTIGYESYENRSAGLGCTGLYVTCSQNLLSSLGRYQSADGSYRWPWHAFVFADGVHVCSAALLKPQWLLASSNCLKNLSLKNNYLVAKLGSRKQSSRLKETEAKLIRIDGVRTIPESGMALLHLERAANETEFIRSIGIPHMFDSDFANDLCVAVGDRTVFLKPLRRCPDSSRCYRKVNVSVGNCRSKPWSGIIACQSRLGWYPAAVYFEQSGHCGFEEVKFPSVQEKVQTIRDVLAREVELFPEPVCSGFRCSQGLCIPLSKKCNGWPDCSSHEDERADLCSGKKKRDCETMELRCRNGRCIPKVLFGDGVVNCEDGSDEPEHVTCAEYLNLTAPERLCDGKRNCYDKSDEQYQFCGCSERKFQCHRSGHCIPKDFVCDGENDCPAGEDEDQCTGRKIVKNQEKKYLEVLQNSYGVWHTMCPSEVSKEDSDALCRDLGYKEALFTYTRNQTVLAPEVDAFSWVKLNGRTKVALRGDRPFVRLVSLRKTCAAVKCV